MSQKGILGVEQTENREPPERSVVIDEGACRAAKVARIGDPGLGRFNNEQLGAMFTRALHERG